MIERKGDIPDLDFSVLVDRVYELPWSAAPEASPLVRPVRVRPEVQAIHPRHFAHPPGRRLTLSSLLPDPRQALLEPPEATSPHLRGLVDPGIGYVPDFLGPPPGSPPFPPRPGRRRYR